MLPLDATQQTDNCVPHINMLWKEFQCLRGEKMFTYV